MYKRTGLSLTCCSNSSIIVVILNILSQLHKSRYCFTAFSIPINNESEISACPMETSSAGTLFKKNCKLDKLRS